MSKNPAVEKVTDTVLLSLICALVTTVATASFAAWDGTSHAQTSSGIGAVVMPWLLVTAQTLCLFTPLLLTSAGVLVLTRSTNLARLIMIATCACILALPLIVIYDHLAFSWTGRRLYSLLNTNMAKNLPRIVPFVGDGALSMLVAVSTATLVIPITAIGCSKWCSKRVKQWPSSLRLGALVSLFLMSWSLAPWYWWRQTSQDARVTPQPSLAQPFYVFGLLKAPTAGPLIEVGRSDTQPNVEGTNPAAQARQRRLRIAQAMPSDSTATLPDVVVIVIESMRPELIAVDVMPNLAALAQQGIHCKTHFSGGNATNHGVFTLVSGLEPIWFDTAQRFDPGMFRWFKSLGYETGFFAGANDWKTFRMDGFIRKDHFDEFEVNARNGIASDRRAVELAAAFLSRRSFAYEIHQGERPRLAIVYLYGTHATYQSYPSDQLDQPAADDRYPFPYPPRMRDRVWNRYRNSARTVDRLIKPLMQRDRVIVAVGDHGEAFLEDGSIGHGIRLSRVQNMTGAVIYCPDSPSRTITRPTSHADILPSLLSCLDVTLSDHDVIDGTSLLNATDTQLARRCFSTRNYLEPDYGLIGPWTQDISKPFAYRFKASIKTGIATAVNAIDERGLSTDSETLETQAVAIKKWQAMLNRSSSELTQQ